MKRNYLLILASVLTPLLVSGQSYYDDDIYYNPSKVKKTEKREVKKQITEETADFEEPTYWWQILMFSNTQSVWSVSTILQSLFRLTTAD